MGRQRRLLFAIDKETGLVWSRCEADCAIAIPVYEFEAMNPEVPGWSEKTIPYKLEKFTTGGAEGHRTLQEWWKPQMKRTRKIPDVIKNEHRVFWGMKPLGMRRYAPEIGVCHKHGEQKVVETTAFPPNQHSGSPIKQEYTCVKLQLACGCFNHWGCFHAFIDGSLRMVMEGLDKRNEIARKWKRVRK